MIQPAGLAYRCASDYVYWKDVTWMQFLHRALARRLRHVGCIAEK